MAFEFVGRDGGGTAAPQRATQVADLGFEPIHRPRERTERRDDGGRGGEKHPGHYGETLPTGRLKRGDG
jgi:hypothetical protein